MNNLYYIIQNILVAAVLTIVSLQCLPVLAQNSSQVAIDLKDQQSVIHHDKVAKTQSEDFSIAPVLIIFLAIVGVIIAVCRKITSVAEQYDLRLTRTKQFWILACAFIVSMILFVSGGVFDDTKIHPELSSDTIWGIAIYLSAIVVAYFMNAKQSNYKFSVPFTLLQVITSATCILIILGIMMKMYDSHGKSNKNNY